MNETSAAPVPIITKKSPLYAAIIAAIAQLEELLKPAQSQEILGLLAVLRLHKPDVNLQEEQITQKLVGYIEDLGAYPIDLIAESCQVYRRSPHKDHRFFASTAQLREIILPLWYERKNQLKKLQILHLNSGKVQNQNPITDEQADKNRQKLAKMFKSFVRELEV